MLRTAENSLYSWMIVYGNRNFFMNDHAALSIKEGKFNEKNALLIHPLLRDCQGVILFIRSCSLQSNYNFTTIRKIQ